jgi:hypothetical protein
MLLFIFILILTFNSTPIRCKFRLKKTHLCQEKKFEKQIKLCKNQPFQFITLKIATGKALTYFSFILNWMFNEITLLSLMKKHINTNKKSSFFYLKQRLARQKGSSLHFKDLIQILSTISLTKYNYLCTPSMASNGKRQHFHSFLTLNVGLILKTREELIWHPIH